MKLHFYAHGIPAPQGSHRAYVVKGRAHITNDNDRTRTWRMDVREAALAERAATRHVAALGPVTVELTFCLPRPAGHYGTGRNAGRLRAGAPPWPAKKPDLDKLARAVLDALTEAGCWIDDAQVQGIAAQKVFTPLGGASGVRVVVEELEP